MTHPFVMDVDAVDLNKVPMRTLRTGAKMPAVGIGTFGSDRFDDAAIAKAVSGALRVGYRLVDCAACYGNEAAIGAALAKALSGGLARSELFVVSKVWNDMHAPDDVIAACKRSLADLRLSYLDCYLVHWPFPNAHDPGCDGDARNPKARPYIHEEFMQTYRAMERLVDEGLVRHIGLSNVTIAKLKLILRDARILPSVNEMELHPCFQQGELFQFCLDHDIAPVGYCPIGSPKRPDRDVAEGDLCDTAQAAVVEIARAHGIHPALVCVKWAVQRGQTPIPFSVDRAHYLANLRCVTEDPLTYEEMDRMRTVERNCRLIKGQVFLWPGARGYLDLWDVDGTIPGSSGGSAFS